MRISKLLLLAAPLLLIAASVHAQDLEAIFMRAQEFYQAGRLDEAAVEFGKIAEELAKAKRYDNAREILGNVAVIRIQQERWQDAISVYEEAIALPGRTPDALFVTFTENIVMCASNAGDYVAEADAVERLLTSKVKMDAAVQANFLAHQGDAYRALGLYGPAVESYQKALANKAYPKESRPALLTALGLAQGNLGRYGEALENLEKASREAEAVGNQLAMVESTSNQGILYWELGQLPKALETLERAQEMSRSFKLRRNEGVDHNNIGAVYKTAGQWQRAVVSFENAHAIAKEVGDRRDEAIALNNLALMRMLTGDRQAAARDYRAALELYKEVQFWEGAATALLGLAKIDSDDKNYVDALDKLLEAKTIYEDQQLVHHLPIVYVELGSLYQAAAKPGRSRTRDLVFEDEEPRHVEIAPDEALALSADYYRRAEEIAAVHSQQQSLWKALQGLGYVAKESGELQKAYDYYSRAIDIVLSINGMEENRELLLTYLSNKDDLFTEAIEVCLLLYKETNEEIYLIKQLEYTEIYRNEVLKANMQMSNIEFENPEKQNFFESMMQLGAQRQQTAQSAQDARRSAESSKPSQAATRAAQTATAEAVRIDAEYEKYLATWREKYPEDTVMFESTASIDFNSIKNKLLDNQAIVQYIPLETKLIIIVVTKDAIQMVENNVEYKYLAKLIAHDFLFNTIEKFGRLEDRSSEEGITVHNQMLALLQEITAYLYDPIKDILANKDRLYIITSRYISYVPFNALILDLNEEIKVGTKWTRPRFLIDDKTISLTRLSSFTDSFNNNAEINKNLVTIGDPYHDILYGVLKPLPGALDESNAIFKQCNTINVDNKFICTQLTKNSATKAEWANLINKDSYGIFHFATHGVPYADWIVTTNDLSENLKQREANLPAKAKGFRQLNFILKYANKIFNNHSNFNGFVYFSLSDKDIADFELSFKQIVDIDDLNVYNEKLNEYLNKLSDESGLLTIKNIVGLDKDKYFRDAYIAILSACNTAVSAAPKVFNSDDVDDIEIIAELNESDLNQAQSDLASLGWSPGYDEISLVDVFMKKNFKYVYGTLWFADDIASFAIVDKFVVNILKDEFDDPAECLRDSILTYLKDPPQDTTVNPPADLALPANPFYWAIANLFGN